MIWVLLILAVAVAIVVGWSMLRQNDGEVATTSETGLWLAGPGGSVRHLLDQLAELEGTPLGLAATDARRRVEGCDAVFAFDGAGAFEAFLADLGCRGDGDKLPAFAEEATGEEVMFALAWLARSGSPTGGGRLVARVSESGGNLEATIEVMAGDGAASPLLTADRTPGSAVLDPRGILLHTRVVADRGLDLGAWLTAPAGEASDERAERHIFNLRKEDFVGLLLGDIWELAVYLPEEGDPLPAMTLAVEVTSRRLVAKAMDELLAQGEAVWNWGRPAPVEVAGVEGRCLDDLRLLPDFTPCYALDDERLYLSWDRRSLARALVGVTALAQPPPGVDERSWLRVELERFALAEERLARASGDSEVITPHPWPWQRLLATGSERDGRYVYRLRLEG